MVEPVIKTQGLKKTFFIGKNEIPALKEINLEINAGEFVVIYGPSGSGKTTLLSVLAGLDKPTEGKVLVRGTDIYDLKPNELARYRRTKIGMVFQQFNLVPTLSAKDNVALPLILSGISRKEAHKRAKQLLEIVGMADRTKHRPPELSGGQQQRIAIARALAANPWILFIDEPTGNLDIPTGNEIMEIIKEVNRKWGRTVVLVTHNPDFLKFGDRVIRVEDGQVVKVEKSESRSLASDDTNNLKYYVAKKTGGMKFSEIVRISMIHFFSKRLRTFLTTLGVALGVSSIVTLVSLGVGLQQITSNQLASLDALVTINVAVSKNSVDKLDDAAIAKLKKVQDVQLVSPTVTLASKSTYDNSTAQVILQGIEPASAEFEGVSLVAGKEMSDAGGVVISRGTAKNFDVKENFNNMVGKKIKLDLIIIPENTLDLSSYKNISTEETIAGISSDDTMSMVYMPIAKVKQLSAVDKYNSLKVKVNNRKNVESVRNAIEKLGFTTTSVVDLINQVDKVFLITQIVLGVIGGVALIVALIGIVNIMTISLLERTHEVGIMKAVGATNSDVKRIFEYEVILFGLFGSVAGVTGAWLFGEFINFIVNTLMKASNIPGSIIVFITPGFFAAEMIILTVVVSLLAGLYPARRAAKLSPMEALRYE